MKYKIIRKHEIKIVGVAILTTNKDMQSMKDISLLWKHFYKENIKSKIPNKVGDDIFCLYIDYESGDAGLYTCIIGSEVKGFDSIPEGLMKRIIPQAKYAVFDLQGEYPKSLISAWQYIWDSDLERTYSGDFEIYNTNFQNQKSTEMQVYVAIE
jgi:predicted transcriptional regulator YdeE